MKRLIRKSSLMENFKNSENGAIYINPSSGDISSVKSSDVANSVNGIINNDGTMYIWPGSVSVNDINNKIENDIQNGININQFRFHFDGTSWIFDAFQKYKVNEIKQLIVKHKDKLIPIGQFNNVIYIENATDQNKTTVLPEDLF